MAVVKWMVAVCATGCLLRVRAGLEALQSARADSWLFTMT